MNPTCAGSVRSGTPAVQAGGGGATPTPALPDFWVERIGRDEALRCCERHPHAPVLPRCTRHCYKLTIGGAFAGLAAWGSGVTPHHTARRLFGPEALTTCYLELSRFFVVDDCPPNTASRFLATTHRLLRKDAPGIDYLFTYAAGFQGLVGTIYQAAGYAYLGTRHTDAFLHVPGLGLVHRITLWRAYGIGCSRAAKWQTVYPGSRQWHGLNFEYVYDLRGSGRFASRPYPTKADLRIWTVDGDGSRHDIEPETAKGIAIVKLDHRGITPLRIPTSTTDSFWYGRRDMEAQMVNGARSVRPASSTRLTRYRPGRRAVATAADSDIA